MNRMELTCRGLVESRARERGFALVVALMVMTVLALVALFLASSAAVNRRIASDEVTRSKVLHYAEAGVAEALAWLQRGQGPDPTAVNAPLKVVQVLNASTGGSAGADTTLLATGQPAGAWLPYSTATRGNGALTIEFRTNPARTQIYKYDKTMNPPVQTSTGFPIFRITSTGRLGSVSRTVVVEVCRNIKGSAFKGAATTKEQYQVDGKVFACGYEHKAATPDWTSSTNGRNGVAGACNFGGWEVSGSTLGIHAGSSVQQTGGAASWGTPSAYDDNETDFYAGPWEPLGMTSAEFWAMMGPRQNSLPASPLSGNILVDNNGSVGDESWAQSTGSYTGAGILYVDGNWSVNGDLIYRGMLYVGGQLQVQGRLWVLGAVVTTKGIQIQTSTPGSALLYSPETINTTTGAGGRKFVRTLAWREE